MTATDACVPCHGAVCAGLPCTPLGGMEPGSPMYGTASDPPDPGTSPTVTPVRSSGPSGWNPPGPPDDAAAAPAARAERLERPARPGSACRPGKPVRPAGTTPAAGARSMWTTTSMGDPGGEYVTAFVMRLPSTC